MTDLQSVIRRRGTTRAKLTKTIAKANETLDSENQPELAALLAMLIASKDSLTALDQQVADLAADDQLEEEIETVFDYELKAQTTIEKLRQAIKSVSISEASTSSQDVTEFLKERNDDVMDLLKEQNKVSRMLATNQEKSMLPRKEPEAFDGSDLTKYRPFMQSFNRLIETRTDNDADRLYYLDQFTTGTARELVRSCIHMDPSRGYSTAIKLLEEKYGDEFGIANAFLQRLESWPTIKPEDGKALEKLAVFLTGCSNYVEDVSSLNQLHSPKEMHAIVMKLPYKMRERWRNHVATLRNRNGNISFKDLVDFVNDQSKLVNMPIFGVIADTQSKPQFSKFNKTPHKFETHKRSTSMATGTEVRNERLRMGENNVCLSCKQAKHNLNDCLVFGEKPYEEKRQFVIQNSLCFGCLRYGHRSKNCMARLVCKVCNKKHPTSLHVDNTKNVTPTESSSSQTVGTINCITGAGRNSKIALALLPVKVRVKNGMRTILTYAGLDNFSSDCFIAEGLIDQLGVSGPATEIELTTMQGKRNRMTTKVINGLEILDIDENEVISLPVAYSKDELPIDRRDIPSEEEIQKWPHLRDIPFRFEEADVGLMIGVNATEAVKPLGIVEGPEGGPYATKHRLGWVVNGPTSKIQPGEIHSHRVKVENYEDLDEKLVKMWEHDYRDSNVDGTGPSIEDRIWESRVTCSIFRDGHYEIPMPFKEENPTLPVNRDQALQRLISTKKRLQRDPSRLKDYSKFMQTMIEKGFIEQVPDDQIAVIPGKVWYLTHHEVYHKEKGKIRVVFNCSLKYKGTSLNDKLLQGPDLANSLLGVLLRFRQDVVAFTADIESMFYQVKVPPEQADWMRFFWFPEGDLNRDPIEYRLTVHVFGAASSPSCANYALRRAALDNQNEIQGNTLQTMLRNFYVDDLLKSIDEEDQAIELINEIKHVCQKSGFNLTKFVSNSPRVLQSIASEDVSAGIKELDLSCDDVPIQRALGIKWNVQTDTLGFKIHLQPQPMTRRGILSTIFSIYDPLGLIGPAILPAKKVFQELCRLKVRWDDPLPVELEAIWTKWISELPTLAEYEIPRCLRMKNFEEAECTMHIFCDGSECGYGTAAYLRFQTTDGRIHCSLVYAKSRLAPLKKLTIPRIELTAAKLAVSLKATLDEELELNIIRYTFWTDSTTVLKYLQNDSKRFQRFVANRVAFIRDRTLPDQWRYVPSEQNPADYASRGLSISKFVNLSDWKHGPEFLRQREEAWPKLLTNHTVDDDDEEVKKHQEIKVCQSVVKEDATAKLLNSSSDWYVLRRRVAWILRLKKCLKTKSRLQSALTFKELENSQNAIISYVQRVSFALEIQALEKGKSLETKSPLYKLNPTIDSEGLLRVGGRISKSDLPEQAKHPLLIPKNSNVGNLIVKDAHLKLGCMGKQFILTRLREKFWIIGANQLVKRLVRNCLFCRKRQGKPSCPFMSDLPVDRLQGDQPPFTKVGIDYFGPFLRYVVEAVKNVTA